MEHFGTAESYNPNTIPVCRLRPGDEFALCGSPKNQHRRSTWRVLDVKHKPDLGLVFVEVESVTSGRIHSRCYPANQLMEPR
jgi:hypothetical protein